MDFHERFERIRPPVDEKNGLGYELVGDVLRIFVRSENPMHRPNTYLHIIKSNVDQINADMNLQLRITK